MRGGPGASGAGVHRGPFWPYVVLLAVLYVAVQLLLALVLGGPGRDLLWVGLTAAVFALLWTWLTRPWLVVSATEVRVGHGPFTRLRLAHGEVDVVRDVAQASRGRRPALHGIGSSSFGPRLVIVRESGNPVEVTVQDVAEAMDDLRAAGVPVSSTG